MGRSECAFLQHLVDVLALESSERPGRSDSSALSAWYCSDGGLFCAGLPRRRQPTCSVRRHLRPRDSQTSHAPTFGAKGARRGGPFRNRGNRNSGATRELARHAPPKETVATSAAARIRGRRRAHRASTRAPAGLRHGRLMEGHDRLGLRRLHPRLASDLPACTASAGQ